MERLYYSISEVSDLLAITQSNLRFWEREFKQLKPHRNAKGTRFYTEADIQLLKQITFLVNDQHLTLEGARRRLAQKMDAVARNQKVAERLRNIRDQLVGISKALSD